MNSQKLEAETVLQGYDAVSELYPFIPSMSHWRAWEYAAYQRHQLGGRILDLGCGDGRYFQLIWPEAHNVVGVDMNAGVVELGRQSGVYREVHVAPAHQIPESDASFDNVFANCSLEHMDHLDLVLAEIFRCLRPGGSLLCSVVTNRFVEWSLLSNFVDMAGFSETAEKLAKEFLVFHHLANPLTVDEWQKSFTRAGFIAKEHIPLLPKCNSGIFLLMDSLCHVKRIQGGEMGDVIFPFLSTTVNFPTAFRKILEGLLEMETEWHDSSGAVFLLEKAG